MIVKKRCLLIGIAMLILMIFCINIWSVFVKGKVIGGSYLQESENTVYFYCGCTVVNLSFFPKEVTVDVSSFKDAENHYIASPNLQIQFIEFPRTGKKVEGNKFVIAPLSTCTLSIISTGVYGGVGVAERHPPDTINLTSRIAK